MVNGYTFRTDKWVKWANIIFPVINWAEWVLWHHFVYSPWHWDPYQDVPTQLSSFSSLGRLSEWPAEFTLDFLFIPYSAAVMWFASKVSLSSKALSSFENLPKKPPFPKLFMFRSSGTLRSKIHILMIPTGVLCVLAVEGKTCGPLMTRNTVVIRVFESQDGDAAELHSLTLWHPLFLKNIFPCHISMDQ